MTAIPVLALAFSMRASVQPGISWVQLAAVAALVGLGYYAIVVLPCAPRAHRLMQRRWVTRVLHPAVTGDPVPFVFTNFLGTL